MSFLKSLRKNIKNEPFFPLGGGDKSIQVQKLDWKANSKVGSTDNIKHKPGGGRVKVIQQLFDF
jgi:microtubule-associated protein tau